MGSSRYIAGVSLLHPDWSISIGRFEQGPAKKVTEKSAQAQPPSSGAEPGMVDTFEKEDRQLTLESVLGGNSKKV